MRYAQALGKAIRTVRKERGLTISDLHYLVRSPRQVMVQIEYGRVHARLDTIVRICQALEIEPGKLFTLADRL